MNTTNQQDELIAGAYKANDERLKALRQTGEGNQQEIESVYKDCPQSHQERVRELNRKRRAPRETLQEREYKTHAPKSFKRPKVGKEKLIVIDGQHYWLQHNGEIRKTDWILRDGFAVLTQMNTTEEKQTEGAHDKIERTLKAYIDAWIDARGCSRLIAAGYALQLCKAEYDAISARVNTP